MEKYLNKVHRAKAQEFIPSLPNNSIDLVVTSPPFYAQEVYILDGDVAEFGWRTYEEYLQHINEVVLLLYKVVKPGGKVCLILANTPILDGNNKIIGLYPIVYDIQGICTEAGFTFHSEAVWYKSDPSYSEGADYPSVPNSQLNSFHDWILVMHKAGPETSSEDYITYSSVWKLPAAGPMSEYNYVYNSFPDELILRCLELWSIKGSVILDPYAGSGQVVRVSVTSGRSAIGIEVDPQWENLWSDINKK